MQQPKTYLMNKIISFLIIFCFGIMIAGAQNNNQNNNQQQQGQNQQQQGPKMPDMQKDTVPLFGGYFFGPIKQAVLLKTDSLFINKPGISIAEFKLVLKKDTSAKDTALIRLYSKSQKFTPEMTAAVKKLVPGQNIFIENIKIKGEGGSIRGLAYDKIVLFIEKEK